MSGNIGVKLDRMNILLAQILERLAVPVVAQVDDDPMLRASDSPCVIPDAPKRRGRPPKQK